MERGYVTTRTKPVITTWFRLGSVAKIDRGPVAEPVSTSLISEDTRDTKENPSEAATCEQHVNPAMNTERRSEWLDDDQDHDRDHQDGRHFVHQAPETHRAPVPILGKSAHRG